MVNETFKLGGGRYQNNIEYDHLIKVLMVGDSGVGKSTILTQYADGTFNNSSIPTIGVDFKIRTTQVGDHVVKAQIWDTAGQDRFRTITNQYYRGSEVVIVAFDVTNADSFHNVHYWLEELDRHAPEDVQLLLVGNKCDLSPHRVISPATIAEFAQSIGVEYVEVSAKEGDGIEKMFNPLSLSLSLPPGREGPDLGYSGTRPFPYHYQPVLPGQ
eukprot:TRINITY_DN201_c0_g1_i9.p1 TRINITY_DN201_c0_g1~~TRINITY_DN201_c0_g1_i9.p1  ORF type:complete len:214 (-),score=57.16 TRINITY_DN201_c0_g1_i9:561-1202(-)